MIIILENRKGIAFLLLVSLLFCNFCYGQVKKQGVIAYKADFIFKKDTNIVGESLTVKFKPGKFLREAIQTSTFGFDKLTVISNGGSIYGYSTGIDINKKYYKYKRQRRRLPEEEESLYDVEYTNDTMTIAGFLCKKVLVKRKNGITLAAYVTPDIDAYNFSFPYKKVKGFPLQFEEQVEDAWKFVFRATFVDLKTPVPDKAFIMEEEKSYTNASIAPHPEYKLFNYDLIFYSQHYNFHCVSSNYKLNQSENPAGGRKDTVISHTYVSRTGLDSTMLPPTFKEKIDSAVIVVDSTSVPIDVVFFLIYSSMRAKVHKIPSHDLIKLYSYKFTDEALELFNHLTKGDDIYIGADGFDLFDRNKKYNIPPIALYVR